MVGVYRIHPLLFAAFQGITFLTTILILLIGFQQAKVDFDMYWLSHVLVASTRQRKNDIGIWSLVVFGWKLAHCVTPWAAKSLKCLVVCDKMPHLSISQIKNDVLIWTLIVWHVSHSHSSTQAVQTVKLLTSSWQVNCEFFFPISNWNVHVWLLEQFLLNVFFHSTCLSS